MKTPFSRFLQRHYIIGAVLLVLIASLATLAANYSLHPNLSSEQVQKLKLTPGDSPLLDSLLHTNSLLTRVASSSQYELQIIYTQINRDAQNRPTFIPHTYRLDAQQYFNPASLVKLPVAALALEKLNNLNRRGVTRRTIMATGTAYRCQTAVRFAAPADSDQTATVGNYIKRMLLVSDNLAYNRLYEFLGQGLLNERLFQLGYLNARITRRFAPCDTTANRYTNPISFHTPTGDTIYKEPAKVSLRVYASPLGRVLKGRAHQAGGRIISEPYDFTTANHLPLANVTAILQAILFPTAIPESQRLNLTPYDYAFLRHYLHATPHESGFHPYSSPHYFDAYKKYLYYGRNRKLPSQSGLHIYNVVGMSHGYLADVAYFADSINQSEFMLSTVLYVNKDGIINDGAYEYESVGLPFLAQLGRTINQYEAIRPLSSRANLTEFFAGEAAR